MQTSIIKLLQAVIINLDKLTPYKVDVHTPLSKITSKSSSIVT